MGRMYSGAKGKSGSTRPSKRVQQSWVRYTEKEVELLIVKMAKDGKTASQIGMILRDTYGIPDIRAITNRRVTKILGDKKLLAQIPEDLMAMIRKTLKVRKHMDKNKQDMSAKRGMHLADSKIKRLVKYYKRIGKLPTDWKYDLESMKLYVE